MVKVEQNACLSTSSPSPVPGSGGAHQTEKTATQKPRAERPDYVLAMAYITIYLEIGWLIFMILRTYSRD